MKTITRDEARRRSLSTGSGKLGGSGHAVAPRSLIEAIRQEQSRFGLSFEAAVKEARRLHPHLFARERARGVI